MAKELAETNSPMKAWKMRIEHQKALEEQAELERRIQPTKKAVSLGSSVKGQTITPESTAHLQDWQKKLIAKRQANERGLGNS